jgi:Na+/melibiose symporter-like transporter
MMGTIVDKTKTKWGKCRPYLLFVPPVVMVIAIATFLNGNYAVAERANDVTKMVLITGWAALSYILWGMSYTIGDIPLWGIIPRMTEVEGDRAKLISLARIFASIFGATMVVGIIPISQALNGPENPNAQKGFILAAIITTVVASLLFELAGLGTKERVPVSDEKKTMLESFKLMWSCKPFRRILISGVLRAPIQLMTIVVMTLFTYYYCDGDMNKAFDFSNKKMLAILLIIAGGFFIGQFGIMGVFPYLIKKIDVKTLYNLSAFAGIPTGLIFLLYKLHPTELDEIKYVAILGVLILIAGVGFGLVMVCQSMMISDCIDYEEFHNGFRPDGIFFSGQSFITKLSAGISSIISAYVYDAVGYTGKNIDDMNQALASGIKHFAVDYQSYSSAMWFLLTVPPAIGMIIAVIPTIKYEITKREHEKMLAELIERHEQAD